MIVAKYRNIFSNYVVIIKIDADSILGARFNLIEMINPAEKIGVHGFKKNKQTTLPTAHQYSPFQI